MPTNEEMARFLKKRGFNVKVTVQPGDAYIQDTYIISCKKSDWNGIIDTLKHISQPGRFVLALHSDNPWWKVWKK